METYQAVRQLFVHMRIVIMMPVLLSLIMIGMMIHNPQVVYADEPESLPFDIEIRPTPGGCIAGTPDNQAETDDACCISGFVYIDGEAVAGAEVVIETSTNQRVTVYTQKRHSTDGETRPYYFLDLNKRLNVKPGDTITITASFSEHKMSRTYEVMAGGQQVDMFLPRNQTIDHYYESIIWNASEEGTLNYATALDFDSADNMYVMDLDNARVTVFEPTGDAGVPWKYKDMWGTLGTGDGQFRDPIGIAVDEKDLIYVVEQVNHRVQVFASNGIHLNSWSIEGTPSDIDIDQENIIYVVDQRDSRILKFDRDGNEVEWDENAEINTSGQFSNPTGIAVAIEGDVTYLYITDTGNHQVRKFDANGNHVGSWGQQGDGEGEFRNLDGIAVTPSGKVYVSDHFQSTHNRVQVFTTSGVFSGTLCDDGGQIAECDSTLDIAIGMDETTVYLTYGHRIQWFDENGQPGGAFGEKGIGNGVFENGQGIATTSSGQIFVADPVNNRVQKFTPEHIYSGPIESGVGFGGLLGPADVATDAQDNLYIADTGRHRILKFDATGAFQAQWGSEGSGDVQFMSPTTLAVDDNNRIYIYDRGNGRIVQMDVSDAEHPIWTTIRTATPYARPIWDLAVDTSQEDAIYLYDGENDSLEKVSDVGALIQEIPLVRTAIGGRRIDVGPEGKLYVATFNSHIIDEYDETDTGTITLTKTYRAPQEISRLNDITVDNEGRWLTLDGTGANQVIRLKPMKNEQPIASIAHIAGKFSSTPTSLPYTDTLRIYGNGGDSDSLASQPQDIARYLWTIESLRTGERETYDQGEPLLEVAANTVVTGLHRISLSVVDGIGTPSAEVTSETTVFINSPRYNPDTPQPNRVKWAVLLYLVGDYHNDTILNEAYARALRNLPAAITDNHVWVQALVDGPNVGDSRLFTFRRIESAGNSILITETRAYDGPTQEAAMDDPETLRKFIRGAQEMVDADHFYLAIADHGQGVRGIGWDDTSGDDAFLTKEEIQAALTLSTTSDDGKLLKKIDLLHLDGCSMALLDVAFILRDTVDYLVVSQYLGWSFFAYSDYVAQLGPTTTPQELAQTIVNTYGDLVEGYPGQPLPYTLSALNLRRIHPVKNGLNQLVIQLDAWVTIGGQSVPERRLLLQEIRSGSQFFESNQDNVLNAADDYVDLLDWVTHLHSFKGEDNLSPFNDAILAAASTLISELTGPAAVAETLVLANRVGSGEWQGQTIDLAKANGLSIYYPAWEGTPRYDETYADYIDKASANDLVQAAYWDEFLITQDGVPPGTPLEPALTPMSMLPVPQENRIYLPLISR